MHVFAGAFPVREGKEDRVRNFEQELAPHRAEWDRLCKEAGDYEFYNVVLQPNPDGSHVAIYTFGLNDPTTARMTFGDTPHDNWWVEFFEDVHGFNLRDLDPANMSPPPVVFAWKKG